MSLKEEDVLIALKESNISQDDIDKVMEELARIEEKKKEEKEPKIRTKNQLVLLNPKDTATYYIAQVKVDDDLDEIERNIRKSIGDYNSSAKKKKIEINNICDAIESIPRKILKQNNLNIKTKEPCQIVSLDNSI